MYGGHYSTFNIRIILVLTLGSLTYGYAFSVISDTFGQPGFFQYFNLVDNASYANKIEGLISGLFSAASGGTFGALTVNYTCDKHVRKITMNTAALICIIGGMLQIRDSNDGCSHTYIQGRDMPSFRGLLVGQHGSYRSISRTNYLTVIQGA